MSIRRLHLYEILVPGYDNDGHYIPVSKHQEWDEKVITIAGGLTLQPPLKGGWKDLDNKTVRERMIPVRIACSARQMDRIAYMTKDFYQQASILAWEVSSVVALYS